VEILSNQLLVSRDSVAGSEILSEAGYSSKDVEKTIAATGFSRLSRFPSASFAEIMLQNRGILREQAEPFRSTISVVIVVTQSNRQVIPNSASMLQEILGLPLETLCFEIVDGCNGFVKALKLADSLLRDGEICAVYSGDLNSILVAGSDPGTAALFGDGFALTLVRKSESFSSVIRQNGEAGSAIQFGEKNPSMKMDGFRIYAFSSDAVPRLISENVGNDFSERRFVVLHQASKLIVDQISKKIQAHSAGYEMFNASTLGNLGPASIPGWFATQKSIPDRSVAYCVGFGAGLSWGYAGVVWNADFNEVVYV
jgi:3-oxoacyl-[acyl-carrier-protein] synthase III